jgi:hypothetical protein
MIPAFTFVLVLIAFLLLPFGCLLKHLVSYFSNQINESTAPAFTFVLVFIGLLLSRLLKAVHVPIVSTPHGLARRFASKPLG